MFKRIKASLANPSSIPNYRKDNIGLVLLYIVLLCFLATIPTLIKSIKANSVSDEIKYQVREFLVESRYELPKGTIEDNTLTITKKTDGFYLGDTLAIVFPTDEILPLDLVAQQIYYVCKVNDHNVEMYFIGSKVKTYTYTELGLDDFDLEFVNIVDYKTRTIEFERLEKAYDKIYNDAKGLRTTLAVLGTFIRIFALAILFDLVCAFLARGIKGLSFKEVFVIVMYAFVPETIGQIIDELYAFDIFSYIGCFLGIVYFIIALRNVEVFKIENK